MAYTGQHRDSATDLQWHRARWLDTGQGRWLSTDPVWDFPANFGSPYGYVGGSPNHQMDLFGTFTLVGTLASLGTVLELAGMQLTVATTLMDAVLQVLFAVQIQYTAIGLLTMVGSALISAQLLGYMFQIALRIIVMIISVLTKLISRTFTAAGGGLVSIGMALRTLFTAPGRFYKESKAFLRLVIAEAKSTINLAKNTILRQRPSGAPEAHALTRHGPHVSDAKLQERAINGAVPDTGAAGTRGVDSTRFSSYEKQSEAYAKAQTLAPTNIARDPSISTQGSGSFTMKFDDAGGGYARNSSTWQNCSHVRVVHDNNGNIITMYPVIRPGQIDFP